MKKTIKCSLSQKSIKSAIAQIEKHKSDLEDKIEEFEYALANMGMKVAWYKANELEFGSSIHFKVERQDGYMALVGFSVRQVRKWNRYGEIITSYDFSPILMAEYGAGKLADEPTTLEDGTEVGQGTFPNQTHADEKAWHWMDLDGAWHTSSGIDPTKPMHSAFEEMYKNVNTIARKVFK